MKQALGILFTVFMLYAGTSKGYDFEDLSAPLASQLANFALTSGKDKSGASGGAANHRAVRSLSI